MYVFEKKRKAKRRVIYRISRIIFCLSELFNFLFREVMPSHFKVKEYCPLVFRALREYWKVHDNSFRVSEKENNIQICDQFV